MAITQDYVDFATGNDYKGATFTDGAYTASTKTLVKNGAFAATKVNHYLYLESNDGGSIVAGYYKVATVPDANTVTLATDAGAGVDDDAVKCVQHDGTTTLPWRSLQGALDLIVRDATNGNQINVKAGAAQVLAASLALTTYGKPFGTVPLIFRGYTSAANDGGRAEIDANGAALFAATDYCVGIADLELHSFGDNDGLRLGEYSTLYCCEVHKGASSPSGKALIAGANIAIIGNYIHDAGTGNATGVYTTGRTLVKSNYIKDCALAGVYTTTNPDATSIIGNIIHQSGTTARGIWANYGAEYFILNNIIYNSSAATVGGIVTSGYRYGFVILNNIICGYSGTGGEGIDIVANAGVSLAGYNAFWNNTANYTYSDTINHFDLTANDIALAADPFTDAANGDFSLTTAGKAALRSLGWPAAYLGAHANTDPHITIGPMQYGPEVASGGGGPIIGSRIVRPL